MKKDRLCVAEDRLGRPGPDPVLRVLGLPPNGARQGAVVAVAPLLGVGRGHAERGSCPQPTRSSA